MYAPGKTPGFINISRTQTFENMVYKSNQSSCSAEVYESQTPNTNTNTNTNTTNPSGNMVKQMGQKS